MASQIVKQMLKHKMTSLSSPEDRSGFYGPKKGRPGMKEDEVAVHHKVTPIEQDSADLDEREMGQEAKGLHKGQDQPNRVKPWQAITPTRKKD
jgi:hypothetical protein